MKDDDLWRKVNIELEFIDKVIQEIEKALETLKGREPTTFELAAFSTFLMNFYTGIEKILKHIAMSENMDIPSSSRWHIELFNLFKQPSSLRGKTLINDALDQELSQYRTYRHFATHSSVILFRWISMASSVYSARKTFETFRAAVIDYLQSS